MADQKFVQFLRELADWYEEHPSVPEPYAFETGLSVYLFGHQQPKEVLRAIGAFDKKFTSNGEHFTAVKQIGERTLEFTSYRDKVCTPKVVGTKHVEKQIIPERYEPSRVIEAHEEDVIEWNCEPITKPAEEPEQDQEVKVPSHVETDAQGVPF